MRSRTRALRRAMALSMIGACLVSCAHDRSESAQRPVEIAGLAGCGPLSTDYIAKSVLATNVQQDTEPTICSWTAVSTNAAGGILDITYAWFHKNSLMFDRQTAEALGYQPEMFVTKSFGGFYWRDPRDPGSCGASAADTGTVTWWVRNRNGSAQPDPCAAAWQLIFETVKLDG